MENYYIFIDETGNADPANYKQEPFYTVTAVLTSEKVKEKLSSELSKLKLKYFGSRNYILHRNKIKSVLKCRNKKLDLFIKDLEPILNQDYYLFQVLVNKEKGLYKNGWDKLHIYKQTYRILLSNILKFSIARNVKSIICTEASSVSQDINIYESFFHFIANGIDFLDITPKTVKKHLTSLNFVTKLNDDAGEQLADLFSKTPITKYKIKQKIETEETLNQLDLLLYRKSLVKTTKPTVPTNCTNPLKKKLYPTITSFKVIP